jgi:IclR family acetate operon transcriptional repressor
MEQLGAVEKALEVLQHLHRSRSPQGVTAIGRALGIPKSTAHRLLAALAGRGFVERAGDGSYRPGIALAVLGAAVLENEPVVMAARPVLEAEAGEETVFLAAARAGKILVLDKQEGSAFLRASPRIGAEIPVHATAIGKLYLALAPEEVPGFDEQLEQHTPHTLTGGGELRREIERVAARGWAENFEEWIPGLAGVAAPVLSGGRLMAALAITGPVSRFRERDRGEIAERIVGAAQQVAARLEGRTK